MWFKSHIPLFLQKKKKKKKKSKQQTNYTLYMIAAKIRFNFKILIWWHEQIKAHSLFIMVTIRNC